MSVKMPKTSIKEKLKSFKNFLDSDKGKTLTKAVGTAVRGVDNAANSVKDTIRDSSDQKMR